MYFIFCIFISCIDCQNYSCLDLSHFRRELLFLIYFASLVLSQSKVTDTERAAQSPQHAKC